MQSRVAVEVADGVAEVRLNRPDKLNALDETMFGELIEAGLSLTANSSVRAAVISGEGRAFCAGLDLASFQAMGGQGVQVGDAASRLIERSHGPASRVQFAVWVWREAPFPVIAAVHGQALGGGFQLMLGADLRFVAPDAQLAILEIKWGLIPDMAGTQLLRRLAPEDVIRELTYTGRLFSGVEAKALGLATRVCDDPRAEALAVARRIAGHSPDAIRAAKRLYNAAPYHGLAEGLALEAFEQSRLLGASNQREAVAAALEKRTPNFTD